LYRNDEIDQVETTDLENWSFRGSFFAPETRSAEQEAEDAVKNREISKGFRVEKVKE
jgi:hypothetical protein